MKPHNHATGITFVEDEKRGVFLEQREMQASRGIKLLGEVHKGQTNQDNDRHQGNQCKQIIPR